MRRLIILLAVLPILYASSDSYSQPTFPISLLQSISVDAQSNPAWVLSKANDLPYPMPAKWSPYWWTVNAAVMAAQPKPASDQVINASNILMDLLARHTEIRGEKRFVFYDFAYDYYENPMRPPWYSALANGLAAIGLMHMATALDKPELMDLAHSYLLPLKDELIRKDRDNHLWLEEYFDPKIPDPHDHVINGHFGAIAALQEWRMRTGSQEFDEVLRKSLRTYEAWLPKMVSNGYFGYSSGHPEQPDYGQERAVIQSAAACAITGWRKMCRDASLFRRRYAAWHPDKPLPRFRVPAASALPIPNPS